MPRYPFLCRDCGYQYEMERRLSERRREAICPECGSKDAKRSYKFLGLGGKHAVGGPQELDVEAGTSPSTPGGAAIRVGVGMEMANVEICGVATAIMVEKGGSLRGRNLYLHQNLRGIDATGGAVDVENLIIE